VIADYRERLARFVASADQAAAEPKGGRDQNGMILFRAASR
jgi:hypothetical protein